MAQRKYMTKRAAAERAATIRRQNVQRHDKATANSKLRADLQRHTANRNRHFELDRLLHASVRHSGLDAAGLARLNELQALVSRAM